MRNITALKTVFEAFRRFPGRSSLILLTVGFGVSTVTLVEGVGRGAREKVQENLDLLGKNLLIISAGSTRVIAGRKRQTQNVTTLSLRDGRAIEEGMSEIVSAVTPQYSKAMTIKRGNLVHSAEVVATDEHYTFVRNTGAQEGRFFTKVENRSRVRVAVLGQRVYETLYPDGGSDGSAETDGTVLDTLIRINRIPFRVIGIMRPRGAALSGQDEDNQIFVPVNTALRRLFNVDHLNSIVVKVREGSSLEAAMDRIKVLLRKLHRLEAHHPDDFTIQTQQQVLEARMEIASRFKEIMIVVILVSFVLGSLGVFAVMTLGVNRRRAEIGLRRAIGATKQDILKQFLFESTLLSFFGAVTGVFLAVLISSILTLALDLPISLTPAVMIIEAALSLVVGMVSGLHPAWSAANLNPVSALTGTKDPEGGSPY